MRRFIQSGFSALGYLNLFKKSKKFKYYMECLKWFGILAVELFAVIGFCDLLSSLS